MTNTVYFHNTIRDDDSVSTTTEEESPATSRRHTSYHQQQGVVAAADAIGSWIPPTFGLNPEDDNNDGTDVASSSEIFSLNSIAPTPLGEGGILEYFNSKEFSFNELKNATRNFHNDQRLIDEFGRVLFKGWIDENKLTATEPGEGIAVAIKQFSQHSLHSLQDKWSGDVKYLGNLYHPNLVRLFGYCLDNEQPLLVYEFMPRGSLDIHLYARDSSPLSLSVQMKIALGAARGLAFLHSAAINVIHRGVTSSNILLDWDYNAKLSDFGFAMDGPTDMSYVSSVVGYHRFIAPEYVSTGHLTAKSDVYSFGAVLIEILLGERVGDCMFGGPPHIFSKREIFLILGYVLEVHCSVGNAKKAATLALQCLVEEAQFRPNMDEVVKTLEQLQIC